MGGFDAALASVAQMHQQGKLSAIVIMLGLDQGQESEGHDRSVIELPGHQNDLVSAFACQYGNDSAIPLICVLIHGGTLALGSAATQCDAVVDAWYPGQMGGYAIADVLLGLKNPAGRASVTSYRSTSDLPPPGEMKESAGKGVTYRYFEGEPLYPFGHGLSYSTFAYSALSTNASAQGVDGCDVLSVSVTVTNSGKVAGDEVVMLFVNHSMSATVAVPQIRLGDFERVRDVQPGQSVTVNMILTPRYHSAVYEATSPTYFQPDVNVEAGEFTIFVGGGQPQYVQGGVSMTLKVVTPQKLSACQNQD